MAAFPFLSAAWIEQAQALRDEFAHRIRPLQEAVRLNVTVVDAPFSDEVVLGHLDTTDGSIIPDLGHLSDPDVSLTVPYAVARRMLVEQRYEDLMIAFMSGEIEVTGDISLILALQDLNPTAEQASLGREIADRLRDITE